MFRLTVDVRIQSCYVRLPQSLPVPVGPVVITGPISKHFVGFVGERCEDGKIAISPQLALIFGFFDGDLTTVQPANLPLIAAVEVDPVDDDCWEIIESNADYFESEFLRQVNVVERGGNVPLWIHGAQNVTVRVGDVGGAAGVIGDLTEIRVKPRKRDGNDRKKRVLRNVLQEKAGLETGFGTENQVLMLICGEFVGLGVVKSTNFDEKHIKSPFFSDFAMVECVEIRLPGFNQVFTVENLTKNMKICSESRITIKIPENTDENRFFQYLESEIGAIILQNGMKIRFEDTIFEVKMENSTENEVKCVYIDRNLMGYESLKLTFDFEQFSPSKPQIFPTTQKDAIISSICTYIFDYFHKSGCNSSILLWGPTGVGKSSLISMLQSRLKSDLIAVNTLKCSDLTVTDEKYLSEIDTFVSKSKEMRPIVVVFDDFDAIIRKIDINSAEGSAIDALRFETSAQRLISMLETEKRALEPTVKFIFTCANLSSVPDSMLETGICDVRVALKPPNGKERGEMIRKMVPGVDRGEELAEEMKSFLPVDICNFVRNATLHSSLTSSSLSDSLFSLLPSFTPQCLQSPASSPPTLHWTDIGGLLPVQTLLLDTLSLPLKYSALFQTYPLKLRSGILLYGPPGCGKTMLGLTVAERCKLNLISVKGPELLNKYIGASEAAVREVFQRAKAARPSLVFFDEFEAIAPKRGSSTNTGVTDRIVNQFLCELDGVESRTDVFVLAASSRPELIDAALLRPGRLDKLVYCGFPDEEARKDIITKMNAKAKFDIPVDELAQRTSGFSGADLQGLFTSLSIVSAHSPAPINPATALAALESQRPTLSAKQVQDFERRYQLFRGGKTETAGTKVALY